MGDSEGEWAGYQQKIDGVTRMLNVVVVSATHLASKGLFGGADPYIKVFTFSLISVFIFG